MKWEYIVRQITYANGDALERGLNLLGSEGWELFHLIALDTKDANVVHCVFKRPCPVPLGSGEIVAQSWHKSWGRENDSSA